MAGNAARSIANARLAVGIIGLIVAGLAFGGGWISGWWLLAPVLGFVGLVQWDTFLARQTRHAAAALAFYERGLNRIEGRWAGTGEPGTRFLDPEHPYAGDLDLFGPGSLFQLLCNARTGAGEATLADWLRNPADPDEVRQRHGALDELRPRLDLREEIARLGSGARAGIDPESLVAWADAPARLPSSIVLRLVLLGIGLLGLATLLAWGFTDTGPVPFLTVAAVELAIAYAFSGRAGAVLGTVESKARDLRTLGMLLDRIEREPFTAARLRRIRSALDGGGCLAFPTDRSTGPAGRSTGNPAQPVLRPVRGRAALGHATRPGDRDLATELRALDRRLAVGCR